MLSYRLFALVALFGAVAALPQIQQPTAIQAAVCELLPSTGSEVSGKIQLSQDLAVGHVSVSGVIKGLSPGLHGFHLHRDGKTEDDCKAAGPHFNPGNVKHASPADAVQHAGDFGNIVADESGVSNVRFDTQQVSLEKDKVNYAIGRAFVVHALPDDLGLGGTEESTKTGSAGARVACCVVTPAYP